MAKKSTKSARGAFKERMISDQYVLRELTTREVDRIIEDEEGVIFKDSVEFDVERALSAQEAKLLHAKLKDLEPVFRLNLGVFQGKQLVGWSLGKQISADSFRMVSSYLKEQHRGAGLYQKILEAVKAHIGSLGYQSIVSRHYATDNRVLIPKLRAGFVITGFEISDHFGILLHLSYHFNPVRRRMLDFRSGLKAADRELEKLVRLTTG